MNGLHQSCLEPQSLYFKYLSCNLFVLTYDKFHINYLFYVSVKQKFINKEYTQLPEFVYDVRLLLLNCYRFFGPKAIQTKRALYVEELLEKRLALLSE